MASIPALTMGGLTDGTPANESDVSTPVLQLRDDINNMLSGTQPFGKINFELQAKVISSDAISVTQTYNSVDTEGLASSDNLSTINGGNDGDLLVLYQLNASRIVTVKSGIGNIVIPGGDVILSPTYPLILFKIGSSWCVPSTSAAANPATFQARLTATTGVAIPTSDVTAGTKLYLTPYKGNKITLYTNGKWQEFSLMSDIQLDVSVAITANFVYDIFVYSNAGVPTLQARGWLNDTTRANNLTYIDGIPMCSEVTLTDRRYVGTVRMYTAGTPVRDSVLDRGIWNFYNRVPRQLMRVDATSHAYATVAWRVWNNDATQYVSFVQGLQEQGVGVTIRGSWGSANTAGIGVLMNTEVSPDTFAYVVLATGQHIMAAGYKYPRAGWNYIQAAELGNTGTTFAVYTMQALWEC